MIISTISSDITNHVIMKFDYVETPEYHNKCKSNQHDTVPFFNRSNKPV